MGKIIFTDVTCSDGAQLLENNGENCVISFPSGEWPEADFAIEGGTKGCYSIRFDIKVTNMPTLLAILHAGGRRAILDVAALSGHRELPQGEWTSIAWYFRKDPGWITPPSNDAFAFDDGSAFGLCVNGQLYAGSRIEVKNVVLSEEDRVEDDSEYRAFREAYRPGNLKNKKVVMWPYTGTDESCTVEYVSKHLEDYREFKELDGLVMDLASGVIRDCFYTHDVIEDGVFERIKESYLQADWGNLKHNFVRFDIVGMNKETYPDGSPKELDWFDDDLFDNYAYPKLARFFDMMREMGASLCFDNEAYYTEPYDYYYKYKKTGRSFAEYEAKVRQRGREFTELIEKHYPGATLMMLYGPWAAGLGEEGRYALLPAFYDGICEAKTTLNIIDGYEGGYDFADHESVIRGRFDCLNVAKNSKDPERYREVIRCGFGIWLRTYVLSDEGFAELLTNSLSESDEYVWIYTENSPVNREDVKKRLLVAFDELGKKRKQ